MSEFFTQLIIDLPLLAAIFWIVIISFSPYPKHKNRRVVLLSYMSNMALLYFSSMWFLLPQTEAHTSMYVIAKPLQICTLVNCFPLYFMYLKLLTEDVKFNPFHLLWVLPGVLLGLASVLLMNISSPEVLSEFNKMFYLGHSVEVADVWQIMALRGIDLFAAVSILLSVILMLMSIHRSVVEYRKKIAEYYSDAPTKIKGLNFKVAVGVSFSIIAVIGSLYNGTHIYSNIILLLIACFVAVFPLFLIGIHALLQPFSIADFEKQIEKDTTKLQEEEIEVASDSSDSDHFINDTNLNYLAERIVDAVESKRLYLNPDLRITDISEILSTNRTYISQAINHKLGGNFSDFVNNYRIEHTKVLLLDPERQNYTIESIAEESGYATVASLNRLFKIRTGMTPNQYRQAHMLGRLKKS